MTKESLEELRERLIRDERVRQMIRVRAYEIYQMRGPHSGGQADDWFQAEDEILAFLIAGDSQRVDDKEPPRRDPAPPLETPAVGTPAGKPKARRSSASKQPSSKRTASKRASSKRPTETNPKPKRSRKPTKPENTQ